MDTTPDPAVQPHGALVERCPSCSGRVFVDDLTCLRCGAELVFDPAAGRFSGASPFCIWRAERRCNWAGRAANHGACAACTILWVTDAAAKRPDLTATYAAAVRRALRRFGDAYGIAPEQATPPLRFELDLSSDGHPVTIGHADGLVTLDVAEADTVQLEIQRQTLGEPYRTPLGHVRHESGHWVWAAAVEPDPAELDRFRALFGDERADYAAALAAHYDRPDDGSWRGGYVSHYAAAHPWEDFAESVAHVLHLDDALNTAAVGGLLSPSLMTPDAGFDDRYQVWTDLTIELNEMARAMGGEDLYPFAPPPAAVDKMRLADAALRRLGSRT